MNYDPYRPRRFSLLPDVVKNLLIINGILFLATVVLNERGIDLIDLLGLHYFLGDKFSLYQAVTYMFMHGSFGHILFNMFAVWMFGQAIENMWGPKRFLTYYLLTGFGAAIAHYAIVYFEMTPSLQLMDAYIQNPGHSQLLELFNSDVFKSFRSQDMIDHLNAFSREYNALIDVNPQRAIDTSVEYVRMLRMDMLNAPVVVGASGAVFGLLLAYGMSFPNSIIYLYFAIPIRAKYFVILYGAIELFSGIVNVPGDNVAHFAHLGGLVSGWIIIQIWRKKNKNRMYY